MKKFISFILLALLSMSLLACASGNAKQEKAQQIQDQTKVQTQEQQTEGQEQGSIEETADPDADWNLPDTIEMTDEITGIFDKAMKDLVGVDYQPIGYLGEKDGVYCVLCRASGVYPNAKPYYALVYVSDQGFQNIWDIWMDAHAKKQEQ